MDKLKNILKSDTPTDDSSSTPGLTGKVSGQGSHFPSKDSRDAAYTQGPESGGSEHVGTTSAGQETSGSTYTSNQPSSYQSSGTTGQGTAAIGQTTTYSTSQLGKGDPTSSVIDHESRDPLTYKKPESSVADTGVPAGSAVTAANRAFSEGQGSAGYENPYKTSHIDPRVDGGAKASAPQTSSLDSSTRRDAGLATAGGAGALGASSGLSESRQHVDTAAAPSTLSTTVKPTQHADTAAAPSTLTTTVNPTDRSAEYGSSTTSRGLDQASTLPTTSSTTGTASSTLPTTESSTQQHATEEQPSMVGRALGAVGLGSVAGAFGYGATEAHKNSSSAVEDSSIQPTTTTGISSYTAPTTSTGTGQTGIGHHRKESIPTTAYPGGLNSPAAINAPVGGTRPSVDETSHGSVSRAAAGVGGAAAVGGAALGAHEYEKNKSTQEISGATYAHNATTSPTGSSGFASATAPTGPYVVGTSATGPTAATTAEPSYGTTQLGKHTETPLTSTGKHTETPLKEDHTARNVALGAGGAVGVGEAVAYNKQHDAEKQRKEAEKEQKQQQKEIEKEQKHHQKELEKEQKHHQKELEKAEKKHEKEVEAKEKEQQKQLDREAEDRERAKRDLAAGAAGGAAAGAVASHHKSDEKDQGLAADTSEKERKPSLFRRIFKKRQNKDTGLEEEYESDEDPVKHTTHHKEGGLYGTHDAAALEKETAVERQKIPHTHQHNEGGLYGTHDAGTTAAVGTAAAAGTGAAVAHDRSTEPTTTGAAYSTGDSKPRDPITGLAYDPSKDPEAARRISEHHHGEGMGIGVPGTVNNNSGLSFDPIAAGSFKMGTITDKEHDAGPGHAPVGLGATDSNVSTDATDLDRGYGHGHPGSSVATGSAVGAGTHGELADRSIASTTVDSSGHVQDESTATKVKESFKMGGL